MKPRRYDPAKDTDAANRVFAEVGWLDLEKEDVVRVTDAYLASSDTFVADLKGSPECVVTTCEGTLRHLETDLSLCCVTGVATSRVGRKQGLSTRTTALAIAEAAARGIETSGLGMFEQGFYNRLGFATGSYVIVYRFDPASITVKTRARVPERFSAADTDAIHQSRLASLRRHGASTVLPLEHIRQRTGHKSFGLGYRGDDGRITHHIWFSKPKDESGPLNVAWCAYETLEQFMELMALLKGLGDQYRTVIMREPAGIMMQDLVHTPYRYEVAREGSKHKTGAYASAFWQVRINDLPAAIAKTHLPCDGPTFNLTLTDPIADHLDDDAPWKGAGGDFVVTLGPDSTAASGSDAALPRLRGTVNAFSRLWLGVLPATTLAVTDDLAGPPVLLAALDRAFTLPKPDLVWYF